MQNNIYDRNRIGLLTMHCIPNYGACLQTYATSCFFSKKIVENNINCEIWVINYQPKVKKKKYSLGAAIEWFFQHPSLASFIYILIGVIRRYRNRKLYKRCQKFLKKNTLLTKEIYKKDLAMKTKNYLAMLTGSDQVWNPEGMLHDYTYLLDFAENKKYSYAACIGITNIPNEYINDYRKLIGRYRLVSLREKAGLDMCKDIFGRTDAVQCLDPTLLLSQQDYRSIEEDGIAHSDPYVFIYLVKNSDTIASYVNKIYLKKNRIVFLGLPDSVSKQRRKGWHKISSVSPGRFLTLVKNAETVVTNSFHGIAFSLIYKKNIRIEKNDVYSKTNSRLNNIINMFELDDFVIENGSCPADENKIKPDYEKIYTLLHQEREKSVEYIESILHDILDGDYVE